jgi:drug/metabolite transporter (DMT)-like permease
MQSAIGDAMAVGCAVAWALAVMAFRRLKHVDPAALNLFKNTLSSGLLLLTMAAVGMRFDTTRSALDWAGLILSGLLGLAVADTLFFAGLQRIDASVAAVADCAYSPTVLLLSALFLEEPMRPSLLAGAPLVVCGLLVVSWSPRQPKAEKAPIDRKGVLLAVGGVMTTAVAVVIAQPVLKRSELVEATAIRLISGAAGLFVANAIMGRTRAALALFRPSADWKAAIPGTFLGTYLAMVMWLGGMKYGTASRAALLNQSAVIFVLLFSRFAGEQVPLRRWVGALIAIAGVVVVVTG